MRHAATSELEDEMWLLGEQGLLGAGDCERLVCGERVCIERYDTTMLLGIEWPRFADAGAPVLVLDKHYPDDGILRPEEGLAAVEVRIACLAPVAYELLTVTLRHEVPGHEARRIPLRACADGCHDVWMTSLGSALAAGARMLKQYTGGFVADMLAECLPTNMAEGLPTDLPESESIWPKDEVLP